MFDTVEGLPVHVLVVHAVVVGIPVLSLLTVVAAARPQWPRAVPGAVTALNAVLLLITWVAVQSGEALQRRLGGAVAVQHAEWGGLLPWFVLALVLVSAAATVLRTGRAAVAGVLVLAVVAAGANLFWVYRVGDSGARSVWEDVVTSTQP